ncbi:MAG: tyrosine-type recombinase/integrase [Pseudomonadota bacterium]
MAKQSGPGSANKLLRYFRQVLNAAVENGTIKANPALGIKPMKVPGDGFKPWTEELIDRYQAHWPIGTKQRLAFDLLLYTGQRRSDVVSMAKSNISNGEILVVQQKTGNALWIPIHPNLSHSIAEAKGGTIQILTTSQNRPFTSNGFGNWFRRQCNEAGIPKGYSAHGLRKAAGRRLAEAGCTPHQIMAVLGHKTLSEATRYTKDADQKKNARTAMAHLVRSGVSSSN